ncbi:MAG: lysylphosphatidylglycerol synthase transmembrane domain-containing protein [Acidobacteria bacterium]|nr:lysylphosphatidylglycerol synthase transmembrane domain-containing protein [Acidobacteriota bacterium]
MIDTPDSPPPSTTRRIATLLVKIVVSAGLMALLLAKTDLASLWSHFRSASLLWLGAALALYLVMILISAWRWHLLLDAQRLVIGRAWLVDSYLVATFFNNFLPSNIGGDVIRIRDTSGHAGSKTIATTVVLMDRGIGLLGLFLVAAVGASAAAAAGGHAPVWASLLWLAFGGALVVGAAAVFLPKSVGMLLKPLRVIHQEWVGERINRLIGTLERFRTQPRSLLSCFSGAILVQAVLVAFYFAVGRSMGIAVPISDLAVIVPVSFVVQMLPVSLNGLGVREATFKLYFAQIGLPAASALAVSLMGAALVMIFSLSGAVAYLLRGSKRSLR